MFDTIIIHAQTTKYNIAYYDIFVQQIFRSVNKNQGGRKQLLNMLLLDSIPTASFIPSALNILIHHTCSGRGRDVGFLSANGEIMISQS